MQIECPSCNTVNKIDFGEKIVCSECKNSFAGHLYKKFKKPFMSATTALLIGAYGTYGIDKTFFEEQRYPVSVEYELVDSCVNSSHSLMRTVEYIEKKRTCICALNKTMEKVNYKKFQESESEFLTHFTRSIVSCK